MSLRPRHVNDSTTNYRVMNQVDIIIHEIELEEQEMERLRIEPRYWCYVVRNTLNKDEVNSLGDIYYKDKKSMVDMVEKMLRHASYQPPPGETTLECLVRDGRHHDRNISLLEMRDQNEADGQENEEEADFRKKLFKVYGPNMDDVSNISKQTKQLKL
jgi:hypothetical protein